MHPPSHREPGWQPGGRGWEVGWAAKGFPRAWPQRPEGQADADEQFSQMPLTGPAWVKHWKEEVPEPGSLQRGRALGLH